MGHMSGKDVYRRVGEKIDSLQMRAPWNEHLHELLKELYTTEEAEVFCQLPASLSSLGKLVRITKIEEARLEKILESLCLKGLVIDMFIGGKYRYMPSPLVIGIFEFTMMRTGEGENSKRWAELFHHYLTDNDAFVAANYGNGQRVSPLRTLPYEGTILNEDYTEVLDYEKATAIIESATKFAVGLCSCRHEKTHLGDVCDAPLEICTTMGKSADYLIRNNLSREMSKSEALENLASSMEAGLVLNADNVKDRITFICHCCKCCCNALAGISRFGYANAVVTSSFIAGVDEADCNSCGKCVRVCPIDAISLNSRIKPMIDQKFCLGCGVCAFKCTKNAIRLVKRAQRVLHPENTFERVILQSLERGTLQNLLFEDPHRFTPKMMNGLVGGFLRLPGIKKALMSDLLRSRFLQVIKSSQK